MTEKSTLYVLQRHLESVGANIRSAFFDPENGYKKIPSYQRVFDAIEAVKGTCVDIEEARRISQELQPDLQALQPILEKYAQLPADVDLPLMDGELVRGKQIGVGLKDYLDVLEKRVELAETSPFERAYLTADAVLSTADAFYDDPSRRIFLQINPNLRERQNGRAVEEVSYRQIYLAQHPEELVKWSQDPDNYRSPGEGAETANESGRRVGKTVRRMKYSRKDEGKVVYLSTHSEVIGEIIAQLNAKQRYVNTGTVTFVEAAPRTFGQTLFRRSRKLEVKETIDFAPHHRS